jgi:type II secretory pathway pseudopilin PulG
MAKFRIGLQQGQAGIGLIETLVAVAILGAIGVTFMRSMAVAYVSFGITDEQQQAEVLARSQLEDIKNSDYSVSGVYPVTVELPPRYSMDITSTSPTQIGTAANFTSLDALMGSHVTSIQEITVSIYHETRHVLSVACYKLQ